MKKWILAALSCAILSLLCGCSGGMEIESGLFVLSLAVDPAPEGNMTVTIKALSGTQEAAGGEDASAKAAQGDAQPSALESPEPGYIVMSATAKSCLLALDLLSATTPRTLNLSQLKEIVINETLARSQATLSILKEIHSLYRAGDDAVVVVTPDDAGDFIRRQRAVLGLRLSKYLQVLFEHFEDIDTIPPDAELAAVIAAMESGVVDAAAVYAAGNSFDNTLVLSGTAETDRLPGHLPRTAPAQNEYLGSAVFSGAAMTGVLTGDETGILCLLAGKARTRTFTLSGAQYKTNIPTRVTRRIDPQSGALCVDIRMNLTRIAGESSQTGADIARQIETGAAALIARLQAMGSDAVGFGRAAVRRSLTIQAWRASDWMTLYSAAPVRVTAQVRLK
ncbi:MAG: hypothetical protein IKU34_00270 [Clostridia bacterium]|nr:hypothetical protein [Clostridia bacterium]